jgi:hypothetical protein
VSTDYKTCIDCQASFYAFYSGTRCPDCQSSKTKLANAEKLRKIAEEDLKSAEARAKLPALQVQIVKTWKKEILIGILSVGVIVGAVNAIFQRNDGKSGCIYRSISSIISPGYVLGCELFRARFEVGK